MSDNGEVLNCFDEDLKGQVKNKVQERLDLWDLLLFEGSRNLLQEEALVSFEK